MRGSTIEKDLVHIYEKVVFWRRNLFMMPNGSSGKAYIRETTRLLNSWSENSPLKDCAMRAIHVMPALLLQKPSKRSKSKEHVEALERRLESWKKGDLLKLFEETEAIQSRLPINNGKRDMAATSRRFKELMQKGNVNGAIKLLTNNMKGGILPLNEQTMELLRTKHPEGNAASEDALLHSEIKIVQPIIYEAIDEDMVLKAAQLTKGGSGPSGMDADGWRKILTSKMYGDTGRDLRRALATVIKKICVEDITDNSLESLMASRLVPLDKNPGLRPIGVGEVLRRIAGKIVMSVTKEDVVNASSRTQMCGRKAGSEAAIHAMKELFEREQSEAVLLVDAANAFNTVNRQVLLHNISITCPTIATFVRNCYQTPARLFVIGGEEILSREDTTQGDPLGMAIYAMAISPLLDILIQSTEDEHNKIAALSLPLRLGGLGLKILTETAQEEYENSRHFTMQLKNQILSTQTEGGKTKSVIQSERKQRQQTTLNLIREEMTDAEKRQNDTNLECGVSNWLTTLPLKEWGVRSKQAAVLGRPPDTLQLEFRTTPR